MTEDPKQKLTSWLTEGLPAQEDTADFDRTRLMSPEQKAWYAAALALDDEYFIRRVHVDMKLMMGFKGRRSDDVVTSLASLEKEDAIEGGLQELKTHMANQASRKKRRVSEQ